MDFRETSKKTGMAVRYGFGFGEDSGDKAIYKAITGAIKYFGSENFLVSTGDDPEREDERMDKLTGSVSGSATAPYPPSEEAPSFTAVPQYHGIS